MIREIKAFPTRGLSQVKVDIDFSVMPTEDQSYELRRSFDAGVTWEYVTNVRDAFSMKDLSVAGLLKSGVKLRYKVSERDSHGTLISKAESGLYIGPADAKGAVIALNYERMLNASDAPFFSFYRVPTKGERCSCWDDVRMESNNPDCPVCHGTGVKPGIVKMGAERVAVVSPMFGESYAKNDLIEGALPSANTSAWTTGNLILAAGDLVKNDITGVMFKVDSISPSRFGNYLVRQSLSLSAIEQGHPHYNVLKGS